MTEEEKPQKHFRGCWCPAEVFALVEDGTINAREAFLLMVVDSLVNINGNDCWASNEYFGRVLRVKKTQVVEMIAHLKRLGLLEQTGFNGRQRFLRPSWVLKSGYRKTGSLGTGKPVPQVPENRYPDGSQTANPPERSKENQQSSDAEVRNIDSNIYLSQGDEPPERVNGSSSKQSPHPRWHRFASILAESISAVRGINVSSKLPSWAQSIEKIHRLDGVPIPRLQNVLKWYCTQVRKGDLIKDNSSYLPIAYSGTAFREKFLRIEDAMRRARADRERREGPTGPKIKVITVED